MAFQALKLSTTPVLPEVLVVPGVSDLPEVMHVVGEQQTAQRCEVTVGLVWGVYHCVSEKYFPCPYPALNVDSAPGVLPAPEPLARGLVGDDNIGAHHSKGLQLPHPHGVLLQLTRGEVVHLDTMPFQLTQDLANGE